MSFCRAIELEVTALAEMHADDLVLTAEMQARLMPPSQRPHLPNRLALIGVYRLAILGELFHPTTGDRDHDCTT